MSEKLDKIAKKYGIKVKDINAENYVKGGLKFILMDDKEALKEVEKSIGADAIAEASKKETTQRNTQNDTRLLNKLHHAPVPP